MIMKKIILVASILIMLSGGLMIMATSAQNIKSVERKIFYKETPILENCEILDVNGTTYVPLRALCESLRKEVNWKEDTKEGTVNIQDEHWIYPNKPNMNVPRGENIVPDEETAMAIGDIIFKMRFIVNQFLHFFKFFDNLV